MKANVWERHFLENTMQRNKKINKSNLEDLSVSCQRFTSKKTNNPTKRRQDWWERSCSREKYNE